MVWSIRDGYGIFCQQLNSVQEKNTLRKENSSVKLLKLHGSLNWLYCPSCGQLYTYEHSDPQGNSVIINGMANMVKCATEHCCHRLSRVIIPPTLMKNYQSIPFIPELWRQAREALTRAREIIVIGYSFPTTDFRSNWMFRKAMVHNDALEKVVIIDAAEGYQLETLLAKHRSIFRMQELKFYPSISKYTEELNSLS
ncbi:hypothetical protein N752_12310 [Desulforamulus aquiferis]|nr:hypothetical protein [Desulforamulus aquiferis]RYD04707.1 hypothetical protein N752_12310 [Desulforamulus aquiferis]